MASMPRAQQDPTLSGRDAESFINHACTVLRSIYGPTPDNQPDARLCAAPPPALAPGIQGLYFPEPLQVRHPTVSWYIANLAYYARASAGVFHTAIAYLERAQPRFKPVPSDPRTAFVAALVLAHRFLEDGSYKTETWARLSGSSGRIIAACVEAMFDALEHRLWIGPLPVGVEHGMFSMREGTIFCEEMAGGQRRCSLPSLSVLYGSGKGRAFGDPQSMRDAPPIPALVIPGPSTTLSVPIPPAAKPIQCLPSPPDSPSSASATPPVFLARRVLAPVSVPVPAPTSSGSFNYSEWRSGSASTSTTAAATPSAPHPTIQHPHTECHPPPPPRYTLPIPRIVQPDESPVFDAVQWGASESQSQRNESRAQSHTDTEMDISPPHTPSDTFNPLVWATQGALITPVPTLQINPIEKDNQMRYPRATLMPPAILDPTFYGRRHSR